jgi:GNAT superfamily N-acetyltransferase
MPLSDQRGAYALSTDPSRLDLGAMHDFLSGSYWSPGLPMAVLQRAVANSLCCGLYHGGAQVGFARMVTDRATFAYLADVYVLPEHRGQGLSKWMVGFVLAHPDLQGLRRLMLATRDAHGLYAGLGFQPLAHPDRLMEIVRPNVYQQAAT